MLRENIYLCGAARVWSGPLAHGCRRPFRPPPTQISARDWTCPPGPSSAHSCRPRTAHLWPLACERAGCRASTATWGRSRPRMGPDWAGIWLCPLSCASCARWFFACFLLSPIWWQVAIWVGLIWWVNRILPNWKINFGLVNEKRRTKLKRCFVL